MGFFDSATADPFDPFHPAELRRKLATAGLVADGHMGDHESSYTALPITLPSLLPVPGVPAWIRSRSRGCRSQAAKLCPARAV